MKFFSTLTVFATYLSVALATTPGDVESDLTSMTAVTQVLDSQVVAFPNVGGTLTMALAIHTTASKLISTVQVATTDTTNASPTPFSESDSTAVLSLFTNFEPVIVDTLSDFIAKKAAFAALPVGGIVALFLQDLQNLSTATQAFENALLTQTPTDQKSGAMTTIKTINSAFSAAITAYGGSS